MQLGIVAHRFTATSAALVAAAEPEVDARLVTPHEAASMWPRNFIALGRLDVLPGADGVEDGLWALGSLGARGAVVLNGAAALLACHDKLLTARTLRAAGLPHPRTRLIRPNRPLPAWEGPVVLKPRFGSWGLDVELCKSEAALRRCVAALESRPWFHRHGVLVQRFVPNERRDLRIVVAGGRPIGAIARVAAAGEWRTNVALGGTRVRAEPEPAALELAVQAATAADIDLVGVDLLEDGSGGYVVLELNGAVDFTPAYRIDADPFAAAVAALLEAAAMRGRDPEPLAA